LSRLLSAHVESSQLLFEQRKRFLNLSNVAKTPFIIGIAGSVAVGKSTTARVLAELLKRWPSSPKVDLVTTDGFLYPNEVLRRENLMDRKGFPESYDVGAVLRFLSEIKAGQHNVQAPCYSHLTYDVLPGEFTTIDRPDILIFEGINVLQVRDLPEDGKIVPFVSDFFDFSIYIDAEEDDIHKWYVDRFMNLRQTAFRDPESFFHRYARSMKTPRKRHCREPLGEYQPEEPAPEHPADAAARRPDPAQGPQPSHRAGGFAQAVAAHQTVFRVTRRSVRLMRPPSLSNVEVIG
jgi:type I pantothenate kinase